MMMLYLHRLKGRFHGSAHVSESRYFCSLPINVTRRRDRVADDQNSQKFSLDFTDAVNH